MATTNNLPVTLVEQSQAQKEITINEALMVLDALQNNGVLDKDLTAPPGSPAAGDTYIVAASPTGAWSGKAKNVAYYDQAWKFIAPQEGVTLWVCDEDKLYTYDGTNWTQSAYKPGDSPSFAALTVTGLTNGSVIYAGSGGAISQNNAAFFWDNSGKKLGIGTASPNSRLSLTGEAENVFVEERVYATSSNTGALYARARGTVASPSAVQNGDWCGLLAFKGYDGGSFIDAARIVGGVDATPGSNDMPGKLEFSTSADGTNSPTVRLSIRNGGDVEVNTGNLQIQTAGKGLQVKEGSNAKMGTAVLVGGTVTVNNTSVTANSRIMLTVQTTGGTVGSPYVSARTAGTSFTITSTSGTDTSTVAYLIIEPA